MLYTVHYANNPSGPPLGDAPTIEADSVKEAIAFAKAISWPPSHEPSVGAVHGYWICDKNKKVIVPWRKGGPEEG